MTTWTFYTGEISCPYCEQKVEMTIDWDNPPDKISWAEDRNNRTFECYCPRCKQLMNVGILLQTHTTVYGKDAILQTMRDKRAIQEARRLLNKKGYTIIAPEET